MAYINSSNVKELIQKKLFILDLDGTVYLGGNPLPGVKEFLNYLTDQNKRVLFITNNSSKSFKAYLKLLQNLFGSMIKEDNIYTSTHSTIASLKERGISKAYILGTPGLITDLKKNGIKFSDTPQAVVIGFDMTLTYEKLRKATDLINKGMDYIMTHADLVCPTPDGPIPDAGSILALIEAATKKKPAEICGKPNRRLIENILKREAVEKSEVILFGDRLYTDIKMANENGIQSVLLLTGDATIDDVSSSESKPDIILKNFQELNESLKIS